MDWVQLHCDRLRLKLQDVVDGGVNSNGAPRIPWSWVCRCVWVVGRGSCVLYSVPTNFSSLGSPSVSHSRHAAVDFVEGTLFVTVMIDHVIA